MLKLYAYFLGEYHGLWIKMSKLCVFRKSEPHLVKIVDKLNVARVSKSRSCHVMKTSWTIKSQIILGHAWYRFKRFSIG